jgi:hypothetical protein
MKTIKYNGIKNTSYHLLVALHSTSILTRSNGFNGDSIKLPRFGG